MPGESGHQKLTPGERGKNPVIYEELRHEQITPAVISSLEAWRDREMAILRNPHLDEATHELTTVTAFGIIDFLKIMRREVSPQKGFVILAKDGDKIIGASLMTMNQEKTNISYAFIGVDTSAHRQNIGTNLFGRGLILLKKNYGITEFQTRTWKPSLALVQKMEKPWNLQVKIEPTETFTQQKVTINFAKAKIQLP